MANDKRATPRPSDRRAQVLRLALTLFAEQGFAGTSVRQIARACEVSDPALYYHFTSKDQMLDEIVASFNTASLTAESEHQAVHRSLAADPGLSVPYVVRLEAVEGLVRNPVIVSAIERRRLQFEATARERLRGTPAAEEVAAALWLMRVGRLWNSLIESSGEVLDLDGLAKVFEYRLAFTATSGTETGAGFGDLAANVWTGREFGHLPANSESATMRDRILDCATHHFGWSGFDGVTVRDLAAACGVTDPSLFHYFSTKRAMLDAIWDRYPVAKIAPLADLPLDDRFIEQHVLDWLDRTAPHAPLLQLIDRQCLAGDRAAREARDRLMKPWFAYLERTLRPSLGASAGAASEVIVALVLGMQFTLRMRFGPAFDAEVASPGVREWAVRVARAGVPSAMMMPQS